MVSWTNVVIGQPLRVCFEIVTSLTITASLGHGENTPLRQLKQALPLFCVCIRQEYRDMYRRKLKTQGVSGNSEMLTDIKNNSLWSDLVLCNFVDLFHAQTATY